MSIITRIGLALGLLLLLSLLIWQGAAGVVRLLLGSGWNLLWLPVVWLPNLVPAAQSWRLLFGEHKPPRFLDTILALWMGRAVNNLLPVAGIGGEIVKARLVTLWGAEGISAAASVMVDKTVQALSVALWGLTGIACLLLISDDRQLALYAFLGFLALSVCILGFVMVQRMGILGFLARFAGKLVRTETWEGITFNATEIDSRIVDVYRHKLRIFTSIVLRTLSLFLQTGEVWLACYLLGHPIGLPEAIMLRSLTATLSDVAFIIPNAYGIQEGTFILVGAIIGIPADVSLAVSLAIRIRDVILDPGGIIALHHIESLHYIRKLQ